MAPRHSSVTSTMFRMQKRLPFANCSGTRFSDLRALDLASTAGSRPGCLRPFGARAAYGRCSSR